MLTTKSWVDVYIINSDVGVAFLPNLGNDFNLKRKDNNNSVNESYIFLNGKNRSFVLSAVPRILEIAFKDFYGKIVWVSTPPNPLEKGDINDPCWYSRLLFSNLLLVTLIFIETLVYKSHFK